MRATEEAEMVQHYAWLVRVTAVEKYMGNPEDPLIWHFLSNAPTEAEAIEWTRSGLAQAPTFLMSIPRIEVFRRGR